VNKLISRRKVVHGGRSDVKSHSVSRNTVINAAGYAVPVLLSIAVVPAYLHRIGDARYGVLAVIWVVFGYFRAFDMGLGRTTTNEVARLNTASAEERSTVVWMSIALNAGLGVVGGLILYFATPLFVVHLLHVDGAPRTEALAAAPFIGLGVPLVTISSVLTGALEGRERFGTVNSLESIVNLFFQLGPLAVAYLYTPNLEWLVAAAIAAQGVRTILGFAACIYQVPLRRPTFERKRLRRLASYGGWVTLTTLLTPVLSSADRPFISARLGAAPVAHYAVPYNLVSRLWIVAFSVSRALFPRMSAVQGDEARALGAQAVRVLSALLTPIVVVGLVLLDPFLRVWLGDSFGGASAACGEILLVGVWLNSFALVAFTLLQGQGRPDLAAKFHLYEALPYLLLLWIGVSAAGIEGVAAVWTFRIAVDTALMFAAAHVDLRRYLHTLLPQALLVVLALVGSLTVFTAVPARAALGTLLAAGAIYLSWWSLPPPWKRSPRAIIVALRGGEGFPPPAESPAPEGSPLALVMVEGAE
jgi:O-antigen/teichoic acid export membrane protein